MEPCCFSDNLHSNQEKSEFIFTWNHSAVLQFKTKQEEFRAAHKLILAWGGFDDLLETLSKLLHNASNIAGSGNIASELNRSKQDR